MTELFISEQLAVFFCFSVFLLRNVTFNTFLSIVSRFQQGPNLSEAFV